MINKKLKLLTIILTGRNDNYMGNFKYRLETSLNFISMKLKELEYLNKVEILITDWNSKIPLSEVLTLIPEADKICHFIRVPPDIAAEKMRPDQVFHGTCAINVALRRVTTKFTVVIAADMIFPKLSLRNLLEFLEGKISIPYDIHSCIFFIPTKIIPWDIAYSEPHYSELDRYVLLKSSELEYANKHWPGLGLACCQLMTKNMWEECRGYDENLSDWGWSDAELPLRINQRYPFLNLSGIGISVLDMDHNNIGDGQYKRSLGNPDIVHDKFSVNDENWGLGNYDLQIKTINNVVHEMESRLIPPEVKHPFTEKSPEDLRRELSSNKIANYIHTSGIGYRKMFQKEWEILSILAWYTMKYLPKLYLQIGINDNHAPLIVAKNSPSAEMYIFI